MTASSAPARKFLLCEGGRLDSLRRKAGLAGAPRAVATLIAIGWLPLIILTAVNGTAIGGAGRPFLSELGPWVRYFLVVPMVLFAEPFADRVLTVVVDSFRGSGITREVDMATFESAVSRAIRSANAVSIELVLLLVALSLPHVLVTSIPALGLGASWYSDTTVAPVHLSAAGRWYAHVSLPLVQFLMLRWLWRTLVWWCLLWRVSRFDLALAPAHADRAGGLGFLAEAPRAFLPFFAALSAIAAAGISRQLEVGGETLAAARVPVVALILCECLLLLAPQSFFSGAMRRTRREGLIRYGQRALAMSQEFGRQMDDPGTRRGTGLLNSAQPSAMIDFASTFRLIEEMRPIGVSIRQVILLVLPLSAPFLPLLLYEYSLKEILLEVLRLVK